MPQMSFSDARAVARDFFFSTDLRKGLTGSFAFHGLIASAIALSMLDFKVANEPVKKDEPRLISFDIAGPETDAEEKSNIPAIAPPTAVEESIADPVEAPVEEIAFLEGGTGEDSMVWTPAPPGAEGREKVDGVAEMLDAKPRPKMEFIDLPEDGVAPTLVSYDMGTFSGAKALSEATRLQGNGSLKMLVMISDAGEPEGCSVVSSSGSNVLDDLGCGLVMTYRYEPGKDGAGRPIQSTAYEMLEWSSDPLDRRSQDPGLLRKTLNEDEANALENEIAEKQKKEESISSLLGF